MANNEKAPDASGGESQTASKPSPSKSAGNIHVWICELFSASLFACPHHKKLHVIVIGYMVSRSMCARERLRANDHNNSNNQTHTTPNLYIYILYAMCSTPRTVIKFPHTMYVTAWHHGVHTHSTQHINHTKFLMHSRTPLTYIKINWQDERRREKKRTNVWTRVFHIF